MMLVTDPIIENEYLLFVLFDSTLIYNYPYEIVMRLIDCYCLKGKKIMLMGNYQVMHMGSYQVMFGYSECPFET